MTTSDKKVLVTHQGREDFGLIRKSLGGIGIDFIDRKKHKQKSLPFDRDRHCALIVLGDTRREPNDTAELLRVAAAMGAEVPVLGVCFGAQALAYYQNRHLDPERGGVFPLGDWHWGVEEIEIKEGWEGDPVIREIAGFGKAAMAHCYGFGKPEGATLLASSGPGVTPHCDAFRVGDWKDAVYGLQFHPEPTAETLATAGHWFSKEDGPRYDMEYLKTVEGVMARLLDAWAELVRSKVLC